MPCRNKRRLQNGIHRRPGVLYLINAALAFDLFAALEDGGELEGQLGAWALLELVARALLPGTDPADPIWSVLAGLDSRPPSEPPPCADGFLARTVFAEWGIYQTADFGEIVFNLVEVGHLSKQETDSKEDFGDVFDFEEAFERKLV